MESMKFNQRTIIGVVVKSFGDRKINCQNCNQPIRDHDASTAHECLELTSLEILSQQHSQESEKEIQVPTL